MQIIKIRSLLKIFIILLFYQASASQIEEMFPYEIQDDFLIEDLKMMVFVDPYWRNRIDLKEDSGIFFYKMTAPRPKELIKKLRSFLNKPFSFETLKKIQQMVQEHYQKNGYPITAVVLPSDQDVSSGEVKFVIVIGRVGEVRAEGAKYVPNEAIAKQFRLRRKEEIRSQKIFEDMEWINQSPFRRTDLIYSQGKNFGETDITLQSEERFPFRVFGGYESTGNLFAGSSRYFAGVEVANLWRINDRFNYVFTAAMPLNAWYAHTGSYILPIQSLRHVFELYGTFVHSRPNAEESMELRGKEWELAGRYNMPFYLGKWRNNLYLGYEFQRTNNFLTFATELIFNNFFDISQFLIGYDIFSKYSFGSTQMGIAFYFSPGNMTAFNKTSDFSVERPGAKSSYVYGKFHLEQNFFMPWNFTWVLLSQAQYASTKLLPTEQFVLGGFATVRGYDENEVISDNGFLLKNELRYMLLKIKSRKIPQELQFLIFLDFGIAADVDQNILSKNSTVLASGGPGVRYVLGQNVFVRFDYGWQLKTINRLEDDSKRHSRGHLAVTASF